MIKILENPAEFQLKKALTRFFVLAAGILFSIYACAYADSLIGEEKNSKRSEIKAAMRYNVIIVMLDTLRADHLGCYGYFRNTSPNIDKLAKKGILFQRAFSQSSFTLPSHASLFTSQYVNTHKVDRIERRLSDEKLTLAQVLKDNGYKTAAFIYNAAQLDPVYGLNQGFDLYDFGVDKNNWKVSFEKTLPAALKWIEQQKNDSFFVFLHANDIHDPYRSSFENFFDPDYKGRLDNENFATSVEWHQNNLTRTAREIKHIVAHYDGGIKYADGFVGKLIEQLEKWSLLDNTIIILLSDHGEILADRGKRFYHAFSVHDEEVHVPLIIVHPRHKKIKKIKAQVQLIDVMPTILDLLGIGKTDMALEGRSLAGLIAGKQVQDFKRYVYAECIRGESQKVGVINRHLMVRTPLWKLVSSTCAQENGQKEIPFLMSIELADGSIVNLPVECGYELYNLKKDPKETKNLINKDYKKIELELLNKLLLFR